MRHRDRITLRRIALTGSGGAAKETPSTIEPARMPATVTMPSGGAERVASSQVENVGAVLVELRAWSQVRTGDRVLWHTGAGDRELEVIGLQAIGRDRRRMALVCQERGRA